MNLRRLSLSSAHWGYNLLRTTLSPVGFGVRVMLVKDESVLLVYHSYLPLWHFPGGAVKQEETLLEAAKREMYEEVGAVAVGELQLLGIYLGENWGRGDHTVVFLCDDFILQPATDRWEIVGKAFFALDNLPPNTSRGYRNVVAQYRNHQQIIVGRW